MLLMQLCSHDVLTSYEGLITAKVASVSMIHNFDALGCRMRQGSSQSYCPRITASLLSVATSAVQTENESMHGTCKLAHMATDCEKKKSKCIGKEDVRGSECLSRETILNEDVMPARQSNNSSPTISLAGG